MENNRRMKNRNMRISFGMLLFTIFVVSASAQIKLPKLVSNGMVLQRNIEIKIWGWASPNEEVLVEFNQKKYSTTANVQGEWIIKLPKMNASGPYTMILKASNEIVLQDVMIGDVWLASGQSNMDITMTRVKPLYEDVIANSANPNIRFFTVKQKWDLSGPQADFESGKWREANPSELLTFSAVAYFYAKEIYTKYQVTVGIIHSSQGGSVAQSWISLDALKGFPKYYNEAQKFKERSVISQIESEEKAKVEEWNNRLKQNDEGFKDSSQKWTDSSLNVSDWATMKIPGFWANTAMEKINGVVWFRKEIEVSADKAGQPAKLNLGVIKDADQTFVNGVLVGSTGYEYPPRRYEIPANVLKAGKNVIVVRVINNSGIGGFVLGKPYELIIGQQKIDLKGDWQYKLGAKMEPVPRQTSFLNKPSALYNAMMAPLHNYCIKGAIWYQGESNTGNPKEYKELLKTLIPDWRTRWGQGDFPFLIVQLPNYMETKDQPTESQWAQMREVQRLSLDISNTGLAVTIDLGEWNDIHPLNKKDVGIRLALVARKVAYGEKDIVYSGPLYQSMKVEGNKIILTFTNTGSGLVVKDGGELKYFAIAGEDNKFVWAKAKIEGNKVIVWNDQIVTPIAVRYAWADNPDGANLYNKEGLPASPFRTEQ
jgi:sialate O-acetylesterase